MIVLPENFLFAWTHLATSAGEENCEILPEAKER